MISLQAIILNAPLTGKATKIRSCLQRRADYLLRLPEQRRIVAYLDDLQAKVDQLKALQAQTAAELDALLPSILDRAFRGKL